MKLWNTQLLCFLPCADMTGHPFGTRELSPHLGGGLVPNGLSSSPCPGQTQSSKIALIHKGQETSPS